MEIKPTLTHMIQQFKLIAASVGASQRFHAYDMNNGVLDLNTVGDSIIGSIDRQLKTTNKYLNNPLSKPNRCIEL